MIRPVRTICCCIYILGLCRVVLLLRSFTPAKFTLSSRNPSLLRRFFFCQKRKRDYFSSARDVLSISRSHTQQYQCACTLYSRCVLERRYSISYPFIQILLPWHNKSRPSHLASSRLSFPLYFARINTRIFIIFFVFLLSFLKRGFLC